MKNKKIEELKKYYLEIPIPKELDSIAKNNLLKNSQYYSTKLKRQRKIKLIASIAAGFFITIVIGINTSKSFAKSLSNIPVLKKLVKVLTFIEYNIDDETFNANIKIPKITGLKNKKLENYLNKQYLEENKKLYNEFIKDVEELKKNGGGHLGVDSGYIIKTNNNKILSIGRYVVNTVGSSSTIFKYDTIDKEKEILITLPSLFKDERYIDRISEEIKRQMIQQHKNDPEKIYWLKEAGDDMNLFNKIAKNQNFYINNNNQLVICFDKYEVAPGYMGCVEFIIPTSVISDLLVSNEYIK